MVRRTSEWSWVVAGLVAGCLLTPAFASSTDVAGADDRLAAMAGASDIDTGERRIDPGAFFRQLVVRYRSLRSYADVSDVVQVTRRQGEPAEEIRTRIGVRITDGKLHLRAPGALWSRPWRSLPHRTSRVAENAPDGFALWMAPHMALKYAGSSGDDFRAGVDEGFTATRAREYTVGDKALVRLELKSGDGRSDDARATFGLVVNRDSMLVEHIHGEQILPDGATYETTLTIQPDHEALDPAFECGHPDEPLVVPSGGG